MPSKKTKIGKVNLTYGDYSTEYSDGKYEDQLEKFFSAKQCTEEQIVEFMEKNNDWPIVYHLSPQRKTLLSWYDFRKGSSLLEIGAGCGAVTDVFLDNCGAVTALELTEKRASILANRYKDRENLNVHIGNLESFPEDKTYDYVTCIGVLEYSGSFIHSNSPYEDFLKMCKSHLKDNGTFILSIENKLGLKYWAGAREDHTWRFFDSIEGYPINKNRKTFSKNELTTLLNKVGFNNVEFYYPVPDMKLPVEVYSDDFNPTNSTTIGPLTIPAEALDAPRVEVFNEWLAMNSIIDSGDFGTFANSFIVLASIK